MKRLAVVALFLACQPPGGSPSHPTKPAQQVSLRDFVGDWRWVFRAEESATARVEDEQWQLRADPAQPARLVGRYLRTVEVRSTDRVPFQCNQRLYYRQRALFDVVGELRGTELVLRETAYKTEPSPCDHGFRHLGEYHIEPNGNRITLRWDKGSQTLWQIDASAKPLQAVPWSETSDPTGPWRWQTTSYDDDAPYTPTWQA